MAVFAYLGELGGRGHFISLFGRRDLYTNIGKYYNLKTKIA